jgi:OPT family oligopeptide transporter
MPGGNLIPLKTMAPDRGSSSEDSLPDPQTFLQEDDPHNATEEPDFSDDEDENAIDDSQARDEARQFLARHADEGQNFTIRGVLVGLVIGVIICFSNMYFGLQTGWVSGMAMPAALIGFAFFKTISKHINYPFTPVENVLVQTVAGAVGTMPLGCGFVGVLPALNYLLKKEENGPLVLGTWKLIVWALGLCFFGVFIAVPLRKEVIIREKLKFPSGTATALMIGVLHGNTDGVEKRDPLETFRRRSQDMLRPSRSISRDNGQIVEGEEVDHRSDWKASIKLLIIAFAISAVYVSRPLLAISTQLG